VKLKSAGLNPCLRERLVQDRRSELLPCDRPDRWHRGGIGSIILLRISAFTRNRRHGSGARRNGYCNQGGHRRRGKFYYLYQHEIKQQQCLFSLLNGSSFCNQRDDILVHEPVIESHFLATKLHALPPDLCVPQVLLHPAVQFVADVQHIGTIFDN
jgi:hypothetical protein